MIDADAKRTAKYSFFFFVSHAEQFSKVDSPGIDNTNLDGTSCITKITSFSFLKLEKAPEILEPLHEVTITEGKKAQLECTLTKPDAKVTWLKNGKEIRPSATVQMKTEGAHQFLIMPKAELEDDAEYTIRVSDDQVSTCHVTVEGK